MLSTRFGVEIEFTGISRSKAINVVSKIVRGQEITSVHDYYDTKVVKAADGRSWKVMYDGSIRTQTKRNGAVVGIGDREYSCELVTPILSYREDIETLQEIIRALRKAGGFANPSCGIHIHLDGAGHNVRTIVNFMNIIYSKNDLFYKALEVNPTRMGYCKKLEDRLMNKVHTRKPKTLKELEDIWYEGYGDSRETHYNSSRYHFLNLHSFFNGHHTVELRGFNSELHAGKVRSYIVLALALNHQALTQKFASAKKPQIENEKFAMRTYLNRIGFIGDEFKNCREHLIKPLDGCSAWRFRNPANNEGGR